MLVFQMQMSRAIDAVPLTRDYMFDWERAHSAVPQSEAGRAA
jgi:cyclopropane-fatty-acyl-phospholipid synthase